VFIVIVTEPAVMSAADGVYVAVADVELLNDPDPDVVHVNDVAPPPIEPPRVKVLPAQIVPSIPAFAVAALLMVRTIASDTALQDPAGSFVVIVSVTEPAVISAADGKYVEDADVLLLNDPEPDVVHVNDVALPPILPVRL
jgi:hypothetical protein